MDELLKWRGEFPILERSTYLISNSLGAMPRGVYEEMRAYADSGRTILERHLAAEPKEAFMHMQLAIAYALLGRKSDALREAARSTEILTHFGRRPSAHITASSNWISRNRLRSRSAPPEQRSHFRG